MARRIAQPNARYVTPATTGEIFGRVTPGRQVTPGYAPGYGPAHGRVPGSPQPGGGGRKKFIDYPRYGRTGFKRWVPSWRLVSGTAGLVFALMMVAFFTAYASTDIPKQDALVTAQTSVVYYADGETELGRLASQNREIIQLGQVPKHTQDAVLAAEDRSFYSNRGVNPTSIVRAAWANARGGNLQGGSTITQQYVKNYFDLRDRTVSRKAKEFFIAMKIDREMEKPEILEGYLNGIYFGRDSWGIQAASKAYFGKPAEKLTVSESAFLAGIINSPNNYDPAKGEAYVERATRRWNYVLDGMVAQGWLDAGERAQQKFPKVVESRSENTLAGSNGYLMKMAQSAAAQELNLDEDALRTGGYKIVTTFDPRLVKEAKAAVDEQLPKKRPAGLQVGMATIDPRSGAVRAIYGGADYLQRKQNAATQDYAQAGSTFKPFGLLAALEEGVSLRERFSAKSPMTFDDGVTVKNFGGTSYGNIDLIKATANSVNTVYVQLNEEVGPEKTKEVALRAGIPDDPKVNVEGNLVNVLGSASPHPIDMASAYGVFAAEGVRNDPYVIASLSKIGDDEPIFSHKAAPDQVFKKSVIHDLTYALEQVVKQGSGSYAQQLDRPVAGKTGTSSDARSAWFVGYTPQLVTAVAMYQNDKNGNPVEMEPFGNGRAVTGGNYPVRMWTEFMGAALKDADVEEFPEPEFDGEVTNPAPTATRDRDEDEDEGRPRPTESENGGEGQNPEPSRTRDPRPTLPTFPTFGPGDGDGGNNGNGNGNGNGGGGDG